MEARWTYAMAREELDARSQVIYLSAFNEAILIVSPDSAMFFDGAVHQRLGPFYLIWTEHHGNFIEHEDEVILFRAYRRPEGRWRYDYDGEGHPIWRQE
jgi:hypothetical protein